MTSSPRKKTNSSISSLSGSESQTNVRARSSISCRTIRAATRRAESRRERQEAQRGDPPRLSHFGQNFPQMGIRVAELCLHVGGDTTSTESGQSRRSGMLITLRNYKVF